MEQPGPQRGFLEAQVQERRWELGCHGPGSGVLTPSKKKGPWKQLATSSGQNPIAFVARAGLPASSLFLACCLLTD